MECSANRFATQFGAGGKSLATSTTLNLDIIVDPIEPQVSNVPWPERERNDLPGSGLSSPDPLRCQQSIIGSD
jgi:hypothetical protein